MKYMEVITQGEWELPCGCSIFLEPNSPPLLTYCPLHKSAPKMYEALKHICDRLYGVAGNEAEVSSKLYGLLKSLYLEGYVAIADSKT